MYPYKILEKYPQLLRIDKRLSVICYYSRCHPIWVDDYHNMKKDHVVDNSIPDWRQDVHAFHWTYPNPAEYANESTLLAANTMFADIGKNVRERFMKQGYDVSESRFPEFWERWMERLAEDRPPEGGDPIHVAEAAMHAMFDPKPKRRYMVVPNQDQAYVTVRKAMEEMVQLNQGQQYSYSREELVKMLDELMAAQP